MGIFRSRCRTMYIKRCREFPRWCPRLIRMDVTYSYFKLFSKCLQTDPANCAFPLRWYLCSDHPSESWWTAVGTWEDSTLCLPLNEAFHKLIFSKLGIMISSPFVLTVSWYSFPATFMFFPVRLPVMQSELEQRRIDCDEVHEQRCRLPETVGNSTIDCRLSVEMRCRKCQIRLDYADPPSKMSTWFRDIYIIWFQTEFHTFSM